MKRSKRKLTRVRGRLWRRRIKSKLYFEIVIFLALISGGVSYAFFSNSVVIPNDGTLPKTTWMMYYTAMPDQSTGYLALATAGNYSAELGAWTKKGRIVDTSQTLLRGAEPNVMFEDGVYKLWWHYTNYAFCYATSYDGFTWQNHGTILSEAPTEIACPFVFKENGVYYMYYGVYNSARYGKWFHEATSTNGIDFTILGTVLTVGSGWDSLELGNIYVKNIAGVYYMFYEARSDGYWQIGLATSSSPLGPFTKQGNAPLINRYPGEACHPEIHKIGDTYYMWFHGSSSGLLPTDIYRRESQDLITWTNERLVLTRTESWEGVGNAQGQVADMCLIEVKA